MAIDEAEEIREEPPGSGSESADVGTPRRGRSGRRVTRQGKAAVAAVALAVMTVVLGACSGGGESSDSTAAGAPAQARPDSGGLGAGGAAVVPSASAAGVPPGGGGTGAARPGGVQPRIVWNGSMSVEVPAGTVEGTINKISAAAQELDGYVGESRVSGVSSTSDDAHQSATLTVRVPPGSFDRLRAAVRGVGTVSSATTSSKDVTGDYVDLQARLDALTATRATFVTLLDRATTIGDVLTVQQQITTVQTQIEQIQGQLTVLADQSDLATLTIEVVEQGAKSKSKNGFVRAFGIAWRSFVYCLQGIVSALGVIVVLLLLAGACYPLVRGYQAIRRRAAARRPGSPGTGAGIWAPPPRYPGPVPARVGTPAWTTTAAGSVPTGVSAPVGASEPAAGPADKPPTANPATAKPNAEEPGGASPGA